MNSRTRNLVVPVVLGIGIAAFWLFALLKTARPPNPNSDLVGYYIAATLMRAGVSPYDRTAQQERRVQLVGDPNPHAVLWYFYPPQFLLLMLPFTLLTVGWANVAWLALQVCVVWPACVYLLRKQLPRAWPLVAGWPFGWAPIFITLKGGQVSLLLLLAFLLFAHAVVQQRDRVAGLCLAVLSIKPALLLVPVLLLLYLQRWEGLLAGGLAVAIPLLIVVAIYGATLISGYLETLQFATHLQATDATWRGLTCSLAAITRGLGRAEWPALLLLDLCAFAVYVQIVRRHSVREAAYTAPLLALLVNPHVLVYDLVLCLVALPVLVSRPLVLWAPLVFFGFFFPVNVGWSFVDPAMTAFWLLAIMGVSAVGSPISKNGRGKSLPVGEATSMATTFRVRGSTS
jgi:alpha-1,2-mannosyltransferase